MESQHPYASKDKTLRDQLENHLINLKYRGGIAGLITSWQYHSLGHFRFRESLRLRLSRCVSVWIPAFPEAREALLLRLVSSGGKASS